MDGPSVGDKSASSFEKSRDPRSVPSIKKANARSILSCLYVFQIRVWNVEQILARNLRNEIPFFEKKKVKFARQTNPLFSLSSTVRRESRREILDRKNSNPWRRKRVGCRAQLPAERTKARIRRNRAWRGKSVSETGEGGGEKSGQLARDRGNLFLFL